MHFKFCSVNAFMAPQLHQTVCVNTSNAISDAASVSSAVERWSLLILISFEW